MRLFGFFFSVVFTAIILTIAYPHPALLLLCPLFVFGLAAVWFPENRWAYRQIWRKLRGRCPMCGGPWTKQPKNPLDVYSYSPTCRRCAKTLLAGRLYGAGSKKLREMCEEDKRTTGSPSRPGWMPKWKFIEESDPTGLLQKTAKVVPCNEGSDCGDPKTCPGWMWVPK